MSTQLNKQDQRGGDLIAHRQSLSTGLFTRATRLLPDTYANPCENVSDSFRFCWALKLEIVIAGGPSQLTRFPTLSRPWLNVTRISSRLFNRNFIPAGRSM